MVSMLESCEIDQFAMFVKPFKQFDGHFDQSLLRFHLS